MTMSVQLSPAREQALAAVAERLDVPAAQQAVAAVRDLLAQLDEDFTGWPCGRVHAATGASSSAASEP